MAASKLGVLAVANDGTTWNFAGDTWLPLAPLPQPEATGQSERC
jgi:hypothetical protein